MSRTCQQHGAEPTTLKTTQVLTHGKSRSDFRKHVADQKCLLRYPLRIFSRRRSPIIAATCRGSDS